jgi:ribonucleoside-diphosphate reductase beta chain
MSLLEKRHNYKPFEHPFAYEAFVKSEQMHWLAREVPLNDDVKDWKSRLSGHEKSVLTQILRFFTQADVDVAGAYVDHYLKIFKTPEVRMMLTSIAAREAVHMQAYSMLIDEVGIPETEYSAFLQQKEMLEKHEYLDGAYGVNTAQEMIPRFSLFGEGLQLFGSFVILLNFARFGKMKGMGQIVSWSIRDETHHVESMVKLYHAACAEYPQDKLSQREMESICARMMALELAFVKLVFRDGDLEDLTEADVSKYLHYIANIRMKQMGYEPIYGGYEENPLPWVDTIVFGKEHANFFEVKATDYAKASTTGEWDESAFDFSDAQESMLSSIGEYSVWAKPGCPACETAQELLATNGYTFDVDLFDTAEKIAEFKRIGFTHFPQIWQGPRHVGGLDQLRRELSGDKPLASQSDHANIPSEPAPQEGASCSLEGGCS